MAGVFVACGSRSIATRQQSAERTADPATWVTVYDPTAANNGYTLDLFRGRIATLFDMNGHIVHQWPKARFSARVKLNPDGSVLGIAQGRAVVEYSWEGEERWIYRTPNAIPHHDLVRLRNGNTLIVVLPNGSMTDEILEIDRGGVVVWRWRAAEGLRSFLARPENQRGDGDLTHINSLQELPENRWFDAGDERFAPGNLLISARNLNAVLVIDRENGDVEWSWEDELDLQHEARMVEPGSAGAGSILVLSNGRRNRFEYRKSVVLAIDPVAGEILWRFMSDTFYTETGGTQQPLTNGNVLITSTRGGRVFEVDREGKVLWQWIPPFDPSRASRISYDATPQLAALERPKQVAVSAVGPPHVDRQVYLFARPSGLERRTIGGQERRLLSVRQQCVEILPPPHARLRLGYGFADRPAAGTPSSDLPAGQARFVVSARPRGADQAATLHEQTISWPLGGSGGSAISRQDSWNELELEIEQYSLSWVEVCLDVEGPDGLLRYARWENPQIFPAGVAEGGEEPPGEGLSPEELAARKRHLEAMGYVGWGFRVTGDHAA